MGNITNTARREILISCYSGAIKTLVDRKHAKKLGTLTEDSNAMTEAQIMKEKEQKLQALKSDVVKMQSIAEHEEMKLKEKMAQK